jgi:glycosidase
VASKLRAPADLYPLYCLLFTMPGVPAIYYGSEWGIEGRKDNGSDWPLRPHLDLATVARSSPQPDLASTIARLARVRHSCAALRRGGYRELLVRREQLAFARQTTEQCAIVLLNAADDPASFEIPIPSGGSRLVDWLNSGDSFPISAGRASIPEVWPHWARILVVK